MRSVIDVSVGQNRGRRSRFGGTRATALLARIVGILLAAAGPAWAVQIEEMAIDLVVDPNSESMTAHVRLHVTDNTGDRQLVCILLKPTRMDYLREAGSGRSVPYPFELMAPL